MANLRKKSSKKVAPSTKTQQHYKGAWEMIRHKANDNTPPFVFWFYKILILSLILFGIIELASMLLKI